MFRALCATLFVLLVALPYYLEALAGWDGESRSDWALFILVLAGFPLAGFVIGRWWVIPLLVVPPLVVLPLGVDPGDSDGWTYSWLLIWGPMLFGAPLLLLGLAIRSIVRWRRGEFASAH